MAGMKFLCFPSGFKKPNREGHFPVFPTNTAGAAFWWHSPEGRFCFACKGGIAVKNPAPLGFPSLLGGRECYCKASSPLPKSKQPVFIKFSHRLLTKAESPLEVMWIQYLSPSCRMLTATFSGICPGRNSISLTALVP